MSHNLPDYSFTSTATREGSYWLVQCHQHPAVHSTVRLLSQAVEQQRLAIATFLGVPEAWITVDVKPVVPAVVEEHLARARKFRQEAAWANHAAAQESRAAARGLADAQLSLRDIGTILGVSFQRAHQLVNS